MSLAVTVVGWGLNWPAIKVVLREWPPLTARGLAGILAAAGLAALAAARGESLKVPRRTVAPLVAAASTNVFAWMGLSTLAMASLRVGECALIVYTMPIWTMLLSWPMRGTRPRLASVVAVALATAGLAVLFGGGDLALDGGKLPAAAMALAAAILFAFGTVARKTPLPLPPIAATAWQVGLGCLPMLVIGLAFETTDPGGFTGAGLATMAFMTVVAMGACYLGWFAALRRLDPATAATGTLLVPLIGVVSAAPLLGEPLGARQIAALVLTLAGVALALRNS